MKNIVSWIIIKEKRVLLIKRWANLKIIPNLWCFPWWHQEQWENFEETVIREIKEEVWLDFTPDRLYNEMETSERHFYHYIWEAKWKVITQDEEMDWYGWFTYIEAMQLPVIQRVKDTLSNLMDDWLIK